MSCVVILTDKFSEYEQSWETALAKRYDVTVIECASGKSFTSLINKNTDNVIFLKRSLLGKNWLTEFIHLDAINLNIILYADEFNDSQEIYSVLKGAKGCIDYTIKPDIIPKIVDCVIDGEIWVDRKFLPRLINSIASKDKILLIEYDKEIKEKFECLTPKEYEIAYLVSTGASNDIIAKMLNITARTVKSHLSSIFQKLHISHRLQLALLLIKHQ